MEETPERRLLDKNPGARDLIESLPDFLAWRDALPTVEVDGEIFWVVGGDQLKDDDQVIVEWAWQFQPELLARSIEDSEGSHEEDNR